MSKHKTQVIVPYPVDVVAIACQEAVAQLGWRILKQTASSITCKEVSPNAISFTWAAEIEVSWLDQDSNTQLSFNGSIAGWGGVQSGHLKGQMGNLQNRVDLFLQKSASMQTESESQSSLSTELTKLARLHSQGILSEQEFQNAKAKLIG